MSSHDADTGKAGEKTPGRIVLGWWGRRLGRDDGRSRALAARLRRAGTVDALTEPEVHELARSLGLRDAERLARLVMLLAEVRTHVPQTLARRLGGTAPKLSHLRFQRLMRASGDELTDALRRAIVMADRSCNVAALGVDLLDWSEWTRGNWCFHYFGAEAPEDDSGETTR